MGDQTVQQQLQAQLLEQSETIQSLAALLAAESNAEIQQLHDELVAGFKETQAALTDLQPTAGKSTNPTQPDHTYSSLHNAGQQHTQALQPSPQPCRFLAPNGRWYCGQQLANTDDFATVSFLYPTEPYMLQPLQVSAAAVQPHEASPQQPVLELPTGSTVYARLSLRSLYERAELLSVQPGRSQAVVALHSTGAQHQVAADQLVQTVAVQQHDAQSDSGSDIDEGDSQADASSDVDSQAEAGEGTVPPVLGHVASALWDADAAAIQAAAAGPQTDTAHFASWEGSTRGIGSKLMAGMGYVQGQGLGTTCPGTVAPLEVRLYRQGAGLGSCKGTPAEGSRDTKKRKRGGERSRKKKFAAEARGSKQKHRDALHKHEMETGDAGLFSLINSKLGVKPKGHHMQEQQGLAHTHHQAAAQKQAKASRFADASQKVPAAKPQDRKQLMAQRDKIEGLRQQVAKLQAMAARNSNDKLVMAQVRQKLQEAKAAVAAAEAATSGHESDLSEKERQKKWMKF